MSTKDWRHDPFFQYPLTPQPTSEGNVDLPIFYFDDSNFFAMFWVELAKAQAAVEGQRLEVVRFSGGKALAAVAFYEYRHTAIAPYNEVGVAVAVVPTGVRPPQFPLLSLFRSLDKNVLGFYILDLPVTTAAACAAGRELWGYPKFITPIAFSLEGGQFRGAVTDPGSSGDLLTLSGKAGIGVPGPLLDLVLYSPHQGQMLRTLVNTRGGGRFCLPGSIRLEVRESPHPMAQRLTALGLKSAAPVFVSHTHALQLRLNRGAVLP